MNSKIIIYREKGKAVEVRLDNNQDTVWLTQRQVGDVFDTTPENVLMHLKNIYGDEELDQVATTKDFLAVRTEGARQVKRKLKHYNLDAIISVGYRVNSKRAVQFRQWATGLLRQHLVEGYTLNQRRLTERGIEMAQAVTLLSKTLSDNQLVNEEGAAVLAVVRDYARSWHLLQAYDEQSLKALNVSNTEMAELKLDEAMTAISELKTVLLKKGEASDLFGQVRSDGLASALGTIEQSFGGQSLYPNIPSRAAHLLYFVIKNHPFSDGNKRIASFLFLLYLQRNQAGLEKPVNALITDNTLVALALLVAGSDPTHKEMMIHLIQHLLAGGN